jgi:4'-phosphopantetheinyl transferase
MAAHLPTWGQPPATWALDETAVHVWLVAVEQMAPSVERLATLLAADERHRAARFHFARDRQQYVVARGLLRVLLGSYLGQPPARLEFAYSPHGKPALVDAGGATGASPLRFNLSHAPGRVLYAITSRRAIGVDIEELRDLPDAEQIAERCFSRRERAALRAMPAHAKTAAFFACWTRKEAYLKAIGTGLATPLDGFAVSLAPGEPARVVEVRGSPQEAARWALHDLPPIPGCAAALAVEGHAWDLAYWQWTVAQMQRVPWLGL